MDDAKLVALVLSQAPQKADAIVLLQGDGFTRVAKAAELFHQKMAPVVIVSGSAHNVAYGSFSADKIIKELIKAKVPKNKIIWESVSQNTKEQAEQILNHSLKNKYKKILLVATHYHQPRAFLTFLQAFKKNKKSPQIINAPVLNASWTERCKWGRRIDLFGSEMKKIISYGQNGDVGSFKEGVKYLLK